MGFISSEQLPTTVGPAKYDVVVGDVRARDSASTVRTLALMLRDCGLLILGSIDDIDEETTSSRQAGSELRKLFERIALRDNEAVFPHIYAETRNKHQFAISFLSAWRKRAVGSMEGEILLRLIFLDILRVVDTFEYYQGSLFQSQQTGEQQQNRKIHLQP